MSSFDNNLLVIIIIINFFKGSTSSYGIQDESIFYSSTNIGKGRRQMIMSYPTLLPTWTIGGGQRLSSHKILYFILLRLDIKIHLQHHERGLFFYHSCLYLYTSDY